MSSSKEKNEFIDRILTSISSQLMASELREDPPILGKHYLSRMNSVNEWIIELRKSLKAELNILSWETLTNWFDSECIPQIEEAKSWVKKNRAEITPEFRRLSAWHWAGLGFESCMAQKDYWSKATFLRQDEALWLSVGLEPSEALDVTLLPTSIERAKPGSMVEFMVRRRELFRRQFDPRGHNYSLNGVQLLAWVESVELEIHPRFQIILEKMKRAKSIENEPDKSSGTNSTNVAKIDRREVDKVAQLFTAMAIDSLGYDPKAARSPVPKEITDIASKMGLQVSDDTVRKYLKLGAKFTPEDWEPD